MSNPNQKRKITVDESEEDAKYLKNFIEQLKMLIGMVEQMFVEEKVLLLSPVMRQLLIDKGREVDEQITKLTVSARLHVDNLGDNLK